MIWFGVMCFWGWGGGLAWFEIGPQTPLKLLEMNPIRPKYNHFVTAAAWWKVELQLKLSQYVAHKFKKTRIPFFLWVKIETYSQLRAKTWISGSNHSVYLTSSLYITRSVTRSKCEVFCGPPSTPVCQIIWSWKHTNPSGQVLWHHHLLKEAEQDTWRFSEAFINI